MTITHAAVLAGRSERMGQDKALLQVGGKSMLERMVRTAGEVCGAVLVVGRRDLPEPWPADLAVTFLSDSPTPASVEGGGPIVGLITALEYCQAPVLLLACDVPLARAETLRGLLAAHEAGGGVATLAVSSQVEPMLAVYTPGILGVLYEMLGAGRRSLHRLVGVAGVGTWTVPGENWGELLNVNDPTGLEEARRVLAVRPE